MALHEGTVLPAGVQKGLSLLPQLIPQQGPKLKSPRYMVPQTREDEWYPKRYQIAEKQDDFILVT